MSFLLDTNVCIALMKGRDHALRERIRRERDARVRMAVSSVSVFELWFGVGKSQRKEENARRLEAFQALPFEWLDFDCEDARHAGLLRGTLVAAGTPIGFYDTLIAAQALRQDLTIVTANVGEFTRVPGLRLENWANPP